MIVIIALVKILIEQLVVVIVVAMISERPPRPAALGRGLRAARMRVIACKMPERPRERDLGPDGALGPCDAAKSCVSTRNTKQTII